MSFAIGLAQDALSIAAGGANGGKSTPQGSLQGRIVTHWTFYMFVAGSVVGLTIAVAAGVMEMWVLLGVGAALCATNVVGAIYASMIGVIPALEEGVQKLADRVKTFSKTIQRLEESNTKLEQIRKAAENVAQEYKKEITQGKKSLEEKASELDSVRKKLDKSLEEAHKLKAVVETMGKQAELFSKEAVKLQQENNLLSKSVSTISLENTELKKSNSQMELSVHIFDEQTDNYENLAKASSEQIEIWKKHFDQVKESYIKNRDELKLLREKEHNLGETTKTALKSTELIEQLIQKEQSKLTEAKVAFQQKSEYQEYRQNRTEFLEWKKQKNKESSK